MPVISAYLPGEFPIFSVFFLQIWSPWNRSMAISVRKSEWRWQTFTQGHWHRWKCYEMFLELIFLEIWKFPLFFNVHAFFISNLTCSSNFRINWIFFMDLVHSPIGVSLQDDINSLLSKIGDPPQFPAFRSQQWIKSDFVRESQMAVVVRFQHPFGWSNLWSEEILMKWIYWKE